MMLRSNTVLAAALGLGSTVHGFGSFVMDDVECPAEESTFDKINEMAGPIHAVGSITQLIAEASDCSQTPGCVAADGMSGDVDFPFVDMKVLATVGEFDKETGHMLVGVPDGMGAYLLDDETVRVIFQSESYGPLGGTPVDSFPFVVNSETGASFTGSHIMYIDYDREALSGWMDTTASAEPAVKGSGELVTKAYNLLGQLIEPRVATGDCCSPAPHFSNTDRFGCGCWSDIMSPWTSEPSRADWLLQSLCSAHLEEKHQWGPGIGTEDDIFVTNEEWTSFNPASTAYTGIPAHAVELATGEMHAVGVFTLGGFEKVVEVNCGHADYVCFSPSGYNGNFGTLGAPPIRDAGAYTRPDGMPYANPMDIVPARLYVGRKGYNAAGEPATDFLSRNGLAYGQLYGFSTDVDAETGGLYRDAFHRTAAPGTTIAGGFYPIDWRWDGQVRSFLEDGAWDFQHFANDAGDYYWSAAGPDTIGAKMEHNTPDPQGGNRFIQGSTAGYFGIYDFTGITALLAEATAFPAHIPANYVMLEGERDITAQIQLGGKGIKANGEPQTTMSDSYSVDPVSGDITDSAKRTFEDVDGLEWYASADHPEGFLLIQEDGGNDFGDRSFLAPVRHDGTPMTYYFVAQSGGDDNTRNAAGVGIPAGTNPGSGAAHEFSGSFDLSGLLRKGSDGTFVVQKAHAGHAKRAADAAVLANDKVLGMGLQAHSLNGGIITSFQGDRGGQLYALRPKLPSDL